MSNDTVTVKTHLPKSDVVRVAKLARKRGISSDDVLRTAIQNELDRAEELKA